MGGRRLLTRREGPGDRSAYGSAMSDHGVGPPSQLDLLRWAEALAGSARTGLGFTESLYEQERYEEVLQVAAEIRVRADALSGGSFDVDTLVADWLGSVGRGGPVT